VLDLLKVDFVRKLVRQLDVIASQFVLYSFTSKPTNKLTSFAGAIRQSTQRHLELKRVQRVLTPLALPLSMIRRAPTRWGSLRAVLERFLVLQKPLLYMECQGKFQGCARDVVVPRLDLTSTIKGLESLLAQVAVVGRLLEMRDISTIRHVVPIVAHLARVFARPSVEQLNNEPPNVEIARDCLRRSLDKRMSRYLTDASEPALMATMVDPVYSARLTDLGVAKDVQIAVVQSLYLWIDEMARESDNGSAVVVAPADLPTTTLFDDDDDDGVNGAPPVSASAEEVAAKNKRLLKDLIKQFSHASHMEAFTLPPMTEEGFRKDAETTGRFYSNSANVRYRPLHGLVKRLLCGAGSSAGAEQAFSAAGRFDSPLRNKMSAQTLERLTVTRQYLVHGDVNLELFAEKMFEKLSK